MGRTGWFKVVLLSTLASSLMMGCGNKGERHYDILSDSSEFVQSASYKPRKVDILWVIDNSGSMANSQANLASSFQSFITRFQELDSDFRMAVITSEAYRANFISNKGISLFRDGNPTDGPSGFPILDNTIPDDVLQEAFIRNIMQGIRGSGDERVLQSIEVALKNPNNTGFRRPDAFLAVIIVSDEEDLSHDKSNYYNPGYGDILHSPQRYVDFLADYTSSAPKEDFSVSAIGIFDKQCLDKLDNSTQVLAPRVQELVHLTGGTQASICDNFGSSLEVISQSIVELASSFKLDRVPVVSSIKVVVDGVKIPQSSVDGWEYHSAENIIQFNGSAVPQQGSAVLIDFDPVELKK